MTFDALVTLLKSQLEKSTYWALESANKTDILVTLLVFQLAIALASTNDPSLAKVALRLVTLLVFQFSKPCRLVRAPLTLNARFRSVTLLVSQLAKALMSVKLASLIKMTPMSVTWLTFQFSRPCKFVKLLLANAVLSFCKLSVFQLLKGERSVTLVTWLKIRVIFVTFWTSQFSKPVKLVKPVAFWNKRDILVTLETSQSLIPVKDDRLEAPSKVLCIEVTLLVSKLLASKLVKVVFLLKVLSKLVLISLIFLSSVLLKAIVAAFCQLLIKSLEIDTWRLLVDFPACSKSAWFGTIIWVWSPV